MPLVLDVAVMTPLDSFALAVILAGLVLLAVFLYANRAPARNYRDER